LFFTRDLVRDRVRDRARKAKKAVGGGAAIAGGTTDAKSARGDGLKNNLKLHKITQMYYLKHHFYSKKLNKDTNC
jgi:hypothetical protein